MDMKKIDPKLVVGALAVGAIALKMASASGGADGAGGSSVAAGGDTVSVSSGGSMGAKPTTRAATLGEITLGTPSMTYDTAANKISVAVDVTSSNTIDTLMCYVGVSAVYPGTLLPEIIFIPAEKNQLTILPGKTVTVKGMFKASRDAYEDVKNKSGKCMLVAAAWSGYHANVQGQDKDCLLPLCMDSPNLDRKTIEFNGLTA